MSTAGKSVSDAFKLVDSADLLRLSLPLLNALRGQMRWMRDCDP